MKNATFLQKMLWLLGLPLLLLSCEDKMDEHYEVPGWVADNAWEVLSSGEHGNYSIFLRGLEISGYKQMLEGKSILTVMAPDDTAFQAYLTEKEYASIDDVPVNELKKTIGYHVLYYSYTKENLVNFRPVGSTETEEEKNVMAGLYYKHRTRSSDAPVLETTSSGSSVMVYHLERYLPVFSYRFFQSRKLDAKSNYEAFYPNSTWTGDNGFNVSNASVKEYGIIANNGYIHAIDRVLEPLETIYTEMKKREKFATFLNLYDSFGMYVADDNLTKSYAAAYGVDTLYQYQHDILPNIACEWPVSSPLAFNSLTGAGYSIFAPSNVAISNFFEEFWSKGGYMSLSEVDKVAMNSFLCQFIDGGQIVFPENIEKSISSTKEEDKIFSLEGSEININPSTLKDKVMCVNGVLYGMDQISKPSTFASVLGPVFQNKEARSFLYALYGDNKKLLQPSYVSNNARYILLIPVLKQFEGSEIRTAYSTSSLEQNTEEGWIALKDYPKQSITNIHSANIPGTQSISLPEDGIRVITTQTGWNFWFIKDGEITCSALFNQQLNPEFKGKVFSTFTKAGEGANGTSYWFDADQLFSAESGSLSRSIAICADKNYIYYNFAQLLKQAGMVSHEILMNVFSKGRFIAFIPTNEAIQRALLADKIPGATNASFNEKGELTGDFDVNILKDYLNSYFITGAKNTIATYPYPGSSFRSGSYKNESVVYSNLIYTDNGSSLSVQLEGYGNKCQMVVDYFNFPFAFEDGCFHLIDDVF